MKKNFIIATIAILMLSIFHKSLPDLCHAIVHIVQFESFHHHHEHDEKNENFTSLTHNDNHEHEWLKQFKHSFKSNKTRTSTTNYLIIIIDFNKFYTNLSFDINNDGIVIQNKFQPYKKLYQEAYINNLLPPPKYL